MRNAALVLQVVGAAALVVAGVVVGRWSGGQAPHAADAGSGEAGAAAGAPAPVLSPQALANLGVTIGTVEATTFVQTVRVQATIEDAPLNARAIATSLGGVVTELHVQPGQRVSPGAPLVSLARAAIERPELVLTGALLPSLSEDFHTAVGAHRNAAMHVSIVRRELARVREFTITGTDGGLPVLPRQTQIDLEYDLARAEQDLANARREIERHGIATDELDTLGDDARSVGNDRLWRNALIANGFWSEHEDAVLAALPPALQRVPWVAGALGELAAAGRSGPELAAALAAEPRMRERFVEAVSLLLDGHSVDRVRLLAAAGELDPISVLRAPDGAPDWDVLEIHARPGQGVEGSASLVVLHDARTMWMRVEPRGEEVTTLTRAFESGVAVRASPLLSGAGPEMDDLRIERLATRGGRDGRNGRGTVAFVVCANTPVRSAAQEVTRTWSLREGLQYVLHVPARRWEGRFVLPATAVTEHGAERVVLVPDGDSFRIQPVHVEYEDADVAVIANDGALFPGDPVVTSGAFALSLGMQGGSAADPHAGHDHE